MEIENQQTVAAVRELAEALGTDETTAVDAAVRKALRILEGGDSYRERRNARVRARKLLAEAEELRAQAAAPQTS